MALLKPIQQENMLLPSEQFHIQSLHQAGKLIPEQSLNDAKPHTQPQPHSTHLVTNLDKARHLRLTTQIPQNLHN